MKNISLRLFELTLLLFAISITVTMYSFTVGEEEIQLWGINYSYYMLPLLAVNIGICFKYLNCINLGGMSKLMILWGIIVTLNTLFTHSFRVIVLIRVNMWVTTFFAAYCLSCSNKIERENLVRMFLLVFILGFAFFWQGKQMQSVNFFGDEARSNAIYCVVTIVPILMLLKKKWLVLLIIFLTFISTLYSNKRGASIIMLLTMIPIVRSLSSEIESKTFRNLFFVVIFGIMVFSLLYISNSILGGALTQRFFTIEETGGSNRMGIWTTVINAYTNSDLYQKLFGHGYKAVSLLGDFSAAHNDFIEVLYDYGIIGLIVYVLIHIYMICKIFELRKDNNEFYFSYLTMYLTFFIMSMVSILIVQQRYLVYMAVYWGYLEGCQFQTDEEIDEEIDEETDEEIDEETDEELIQQRIKINSVIQNIQ